MPANPSLSVVVPVLNETEIILESLSRLDTVLASLTGGFDIIVVDDGSTDDTVEKVEQWIDAHPQVRLLSLSRNFGHQSAITAGMTVAKGDFVAIIDADLQDPPELLPDMVTQAQRGYDVVYGVRRSRDSKWYKRTAYWCYYRLLRVVSEQVIPVDAGDFSVMSSRVVAELNKLAERGRFVRSLRTWVGFKQIGFPYDRPARAGGAPSYGIKRLFQLAATGVLASSRLPLKLAVYLGLGVSALGFLWALKILLARLVFNTAPQGFSATMLAILILGGAQLVAIGVVGYYLGRVLDQVEGRPNFIISRTVNLPDTKK
ncbi:MAG: glycosyltransferase family 2 protein [Gammaproteobacteria bacterium]|nr:glycosyltransferase family 2 protein [Gammaproteobacteria bacterium]